MDEDYFLRDSVDARKWYEDKFFAINHFDTHHRKNFSFSENHPLYYPIISERLFKNGFRPHYPDNKDFAICLTHDIDIVSSRPPLRRIVNNFRHGKVSKLRKDLGIYLDPKKSEFYNIHKMLEHENRYNANSTYFFLSLTKGEQDFNYNPSDIKGILEQVKQAGSEVGLHGGHEASLSANKIISEKKLLEQASGTVITGYRSHYLKFRYPETWKYLEEASIKYDTTYSYPEIIGFRNGMCYPFKPSNVNSLLEYPLIVADHVLFNYMKTDNDTAFSLIKLLMKRVQEVKGVMVILWHNMYYMDDFIGLYDKILKLGTENNAWVTSGDKLNSWWIKNNFTADYAKFCPEIFS
jgi:peptidoglycan/xylan/chitin deacetylase (PgdA/CDA1 family)